MALKLAVHIKISETGVRLNHIRFLLLSGVAVPQARP